MALLRLSAFQSQFALFLLSGQSFVRQVEGLLAGKVVKAVACGAAHILALTADGGVFTWGYGGEGQLGIGTTYNVPIPIVVGSPLGAKIVRMISAAEFQSAAVTVSGDLYTWGAGEDGRLGHGDEEARLLPTLVQALSRSMILHVSCGLEHMSAVTDKGELFTWGEGSGGRCGHGDAETVYTPVRVRGALEGVKQSQVSCGAFHTLSLDNQV